MTSILPATEDDDFEGELTEGYRGMADVEDLLWDEENDQGAAIDPNTWMEVQQACTDKAHVACPTPHPRLHADRVVKLHILV